MRTPAPLLALILLANPAHAQPALKPELAGVAFLLGHWTHGQGQVADTGGTSIGTSDIEPAVGGTALLRRDHTNLFDAAGKPTGGFDQLMLIYPEADHLHADYLDGTHVIHYVNVTVIPGRYVAFATAAPTAAPNFKLTYTLIDTRTLAISFQIAPPNTADFHPIANGTLKK